MMMRQAAAERQMGLEGRSAASETAVAAIEVATSQAEAAGKAAGGRNGCPGHQG